MVAPKIVTSLLFLASLSCSGCSILTRLTAAPTVDTLGNIGADVRLSVTPAFGGPGDRVYLGGWIGVNTEVGGSYLASEKVGAAQVRLTPEIAWPLAPVQLRFGLGYSGRYTGPIDSCAAEPGASALLHGLVGYLGVESLLPQREEHRFGAITLGAELAGEFLHGSGPCGPANRGVFSLGPSLAISWTIYK